MEKRKNASATGKSILIFISFGNIKSTSMHGQIEQIKQLVCSSYREHDYLLEHLDADSASIFRSYYSDISEEMAINGIHVLSELMHKVY